VVCCLMQQLISISSMELNSALECSWGNLSDSRRCGARRSWARGMGSLFGVRDRERVESVHLEAMWGFLPLMAPPMVPPPLCRHSGRRWSRRFKQSFFLIFLVLVSLRLVSCVSCVMHYVSTGNGLINLRQGYGLLFKKNHWVHLYSVTKLYYGHNSPSKVVNFELI
jgi:hypothetical protein